MTRLKGKLLEERAHHDTFEGDPQRCRFVAVLGVTDHAHASRSRYACKSNVVNISAFFWI